MVERVIEDVRRILLGLLFFFAFGWMAAQLLPGRSDEPLPQQVASLDLRSEMVPPRP